MLNMAIPRIQLKRANLYNPLGEIPIINIVHLQYLLCCFKCAFFFYRERGGRKGGREGQRERERKDEYGMLPFFLRGNYVLISSLDPSTRTICRQDSMWSHLFQIPSYPV